MLGSVSVNKQASQGIWRASCSVRTSFLHRVPLSAVTLQAKQLCEGFVYSAEMCF